MQCYRDPVFQHTCTRHTIYCSNPVDNLTPVCQYRHHGIRIQEPGSVHCRTAIPVSEWNNAGRSPKTSMRGGYCQSARQLLFPVMDTLPGWRRSRCGAVRYRNNPLPVHTCGGHRSPLQASCTALSVSGFITSGCYRNWISSSYGLISRRGPLNPGTSPAFPTSCFEGSCASPHFSPHQILGGLYY